MSARFNRSLADAIMNKIKKLYSLVLSDVGNRVPLALIQEFSAIFGSNQIKELYTAGSRIADETIGCFAEMSEELQLEHTTMVAVNQ